MRRKNPARKSAKKSGGSKIKIREKSVLPKSGPKKWEVHVIRMGGVFYYFQPTHLSLKMPRTMPLPPWGPDGT